MSTRLEGLLYDEFTPKQVEDFKITFNLFDADSSGFIGEEELKFWLEALDIGVSKRKVF
jgi:Ca2+-binding EF-hand superfamily protein